MRFAQTVALLAGIQLCLGFDLAPYKQQFQTEVAVPYKSAIGVVASNIIEFLANAPVPTTTDASQQVAAQLKAEAQTFSGNLGAASRGSDGIRVQLDVEVEKLVSEGSGVEQQIEAKEKQLQEVNGRIQEANGQVNEAQNQVNAAQQSVNHAQQVLNDEQRRVDESRNHCTFFGGWFGKIVCQVFNSGGIDRAKEARGRAENDLNNRRQRLAQLQTTLAQARQQHSVLQQEKASLEANKAQLSSQLQQVRQMRDQATNVNARLKDVIAHVTTLFGKSQVLVDVVTQLVDMETVIIPLTAIADQIISYTRNGDDATYLTTMKEKIATYLPVIKQKLSQYALIPPAS